MCLVEVMRFMIIVVDTYVVEREHGKVTHKAYASVNSRSRRTVLRTVAAAVVETVQAPPAMTFLHDLHFQMPTASRLTTPCLKFQNVQAHS